MSLSHTHTHTHTHTHAQASFDPPGLTIAVKKDRSMEPFMQTGMKFAVSECTGLL